MDEVTSRNRSPHAMTDAFTAAGFRISRISDPPPEAWDLFFGRYHLLATALSFLFFVLQAE